MNNVLLTGPPGSGKTTLLFAVLRALRPFPSRPGGLAVGGFTVKRVYRRRQRVALDLVDLSTGRRGRLVDFSQPPGPVVDRAVFVDIAVPAIHQALRQADVVVLDELGRFEIGVEPFVSAVEMALESPRLVLGVIKAECNPFLDRVRSRRDVTLIPVTREERERARATLQDALACWNRPLA